MFALIAASSAALAGQGGQTGWPQEPPKCGWIRGGVWSCSDTLTNGTTINANEYLYMLTCEQHSDRSTCDRERARILKEAR